MKEHWNKSLTGISEDPQKISSLENNEEVSWDILEETPEGISAGIQEGIFERVPEEMSGEIFSRWMNF